MKLVEGKYTVQHLSDCAKNIVATKTKYSKVLDDSAERVVPRYAETELSISRVLGRGGFCVVYELNDTKFIIDCDGSISSSTLPSKDISFSDDCLTKRNNQKKPTFQTHSTNKNKKGGQYVMKKMQESCYNDASTFLNGLVDLALEAKYLSVLRHPNIIQMRATALCSSCDVEFFIVLDRLYDTLNRRLIKWKQQNGGGLKKLLKLNTKKDELFLVQRLTMAHELASAIKYMHSMNIIFRDIKPDNIGFDIHDNVKIFDFGLAREMDSSLKEKNGLYRLTGDCGSLRYMDPRVALGKPYNELSDVYSFSVLLWEILELRLPYEFFTMKMHQKLVIDEGVRPRINETWSPNIQSLIRTGFGDIQQRPSMTDVGDSIQSEILCITGKGQ